MAEVIVPDDRFLHPRCRMSVKVSALSHLEYRVWTDYILVADNFGVLPYAAVMIRAGNPALAAEPEDLIVTALDHVVASGLLIPFEHQAQRYLCDPLWQDFQKIRYPRATWYPVPTPEVFQQLSRETRVLFRNFHGMFRENPDACNRPGYRLEAKGKRLVVQEGESEGEGFPEFYERYPRHVGRDAADKAWRVAVQKTTPAEIMAGLERQHTELTSRDPKYIPHPATWLNQGRWTDEPAKVQLLRPKNAAAAQEFLARGPRLKP